MTNNTSNKKNSIKYQSNILRQIFEVKKIPNPWKKSIGAAICTGVPMLLGLFFNQPQWSSIGALGSFAYLYSTNETYYRRAKKMFFVVLGFTVTVFLGTLAAPYPLLVTIILCLIGAIATFMFGVLRIPGPAAIFFVLIYLIITSMPTGDLLERTLIVFLSASFAWLVSMVGALFNSNGTETRALKNIYMVLADFGDAIGNDNVSSVRNQTVNSMKEAEEILLTAHIPWKESSVFSRLTLLNEQANLLFIQLLDLSYEKGARLDRKISDIVREIAYTINQKSSKTSRTILTSNIELNQIFLDKSKEEQRMYGNIIEILKSIEENMDTSLQEVKNITKKRKVSKRFQLMESFSADSIAFHKAIRYGVILAIASLVSYAVPIYKSYWIPLSCASVMLGSTIIGTFNRAIQRSIGTLLGLGLAALVLNLNTEGYKLIIVTMILTAITEFIIARNYAFAAIFITANAILIAENNASFINSEVFLKARIANVVIGAAIGLIGTFLMGYHSASIRLKPMLLKLLHSQSKVLEVLVNSQGNETNNELVIVIEKMEMDLTNLKTTYTTALGEIGSRRESLITMWPIMFSLEYINYLLNQNVIMKGSLELSRNDMNILLGAYESMIISLEKGHPIIVREVPILEEIPKICKEVNALQDFFSKRNI